MELMFDSLHAFWIFGAKFAKKKRSVNMGKLFSYSSHKTQPTHKKYLYK